MEDDRTKIQPRARFVPENRFRELRGERLREFRGRMMIPCRDGEKEHARVNWGIIQFTKPLYRLETFEA